MKTFQLRKKESFQPVFQRYFSTENFSDSLDPLADVFFSVRNFDFKEVLDFLKTNEEIGRNFKNYIHQLFSGKPFLISLTEANILSETSFFSEFKKRILNQILPAVDNENTIWHLVDYVLVNPQKIWSISEISKKMIWMNFSVCSIFTILFQKTRLKKKFIWR